MAKLNFNAAAYHYEAGLNAIQLMWVAAGSALRNRLSEVEQDQLEYERHLDGGGNPICEWDGPDPLYDQGDLCRLEQQSLEDAIQELNVATAIAIYHHWERFTPKISHNTSRAHPILKEEALESGINLHDDIDALHFSANYLKHGTKKWLDNLLADFGDKILTARFTNQNGPAWVRRLVLNDDHIEWFFEIATASRRPIVSDI